MNYRNLPYRQIHTAVLAGVALMLPLSEYMVTVFILLLVLNLLLALFAGNIKAPAQSIRYHLSALLIAWATLAAGMVFTAAINDGLAALLLKLPLLLIPLTCLFMTDLSRRDLDLISVSFIAGVLTSSAAGTIMAVSENADLSDGRLLSPFISHIRLAVMVVLSLALLLGLYYRYNTITRRLVIITVSAWMIFFLFVMQALTGIVLLGLLLISLAIMRLRGARHQAIRIVSITSVILLPVAAIVIIAAGFNRFREIDEAEIDYDRPTLQGNSYSHDPGRPDSENGNYTWRYICEPELRREWNRRSELDYDGPDRRGQELKVTLIRYLTSAGVEKDSAGLSTLEDTEINLINDGYASNIYLSGSRFSVKRYELFWQVDYYLDGGNPQGHSLTQRLELMGNGLRVVKRLPLTGAGTGDLAAEIMKQYEAGQSRLSREYRLMPHNQYITTLAMLGIPLAAIFWIALLLPLIRGRQKIPYLLQLSMLILFISFLWEDGLETHTGVTLFSLFYAMALSVSVSRDE